ncbi:hypothetical protein SAMN06297280_3504 [Arsukibacterium tuosuense]|uniref:Uncharacterized protein n=1 Tax=Arsukibacterium tuosuense TaxID=1323745 RepID=A0A285JHL1_9GAMM|nr:DUF6544 family protein [Arsukibacterium tuosuense]SNY58866.1 hypothetical protein SAMN06297280_3504 [Arsukibacterium tuosuense]
MTDIIALIISITAVVLILLIAGLLCLRLLDYQTDKQMVQRLIAQQPQQPDQFDPLLLHGLPDAAKRFFLFSIAPGTPLYTVADIGMTGRFGMGNSRRPDYLNMQARQILAPPDGFIWQMQARRSLLRISGSDSASWTRFWLYELLPVARQGASPDQRRSAFGRYVAESLFWTPAAVLSGTGITWSHLSENSARLTVKYLGLEQSVDLTVADNGQPLHVSFMRWSNANPQRRYTLQPFGGYLSGFRDFAGFRLPTHVEAGNHFGTADYFAFFVADIQQIRWPRHHN